jgi:hypothetical protein
VEVLAGVKHRPRYATFLTSSSPSFRHSSGQCDVRAVYDRAGVADYMAKQLTRPGYAETFILSTEFHNT